MGKSASVPAILNTYVISVQVKLIKSKSVVIFIGVEVFICSVDLGFLWAADIYFVFIGKLNFN